MLKFLLMEIHLLPNSWSHSLTTRAWLLSIFKSNSLKYFLIQKHAEIISLMIRLHESLVQYNIDDSASRGITPFKVLGFLEVSGLLSIKCRSQYLAAVQIL